VKIGGCVTAIGFVGGPVAGAGFLVSLSFPSHFTPLFVSLGCEGDARIQRGEMKIGKDKGEWRRGKRGEREKVLIPC
jgi:hypothetical protein